MLLGKPESKFEVYNDIDGELVNLFRVIKNRPAELLLELDLLPLNSRSEFNQWLRFHDGGNDPATYLETQEVILDGTLPKEWAEEMKQSLRRRANYWEVRQAAAFLMRIRNSYSSSGRSFACQPFDIRSLFDMIWEMSFRLSNVIVEEQSFEVLIPHYDRVDSFFYGDPPYYNSEYVYDADFDWDHHVLLKETLAQCKGKWLIAYSTVPGEGYLSDKGVEKMRSTLAREIFSQDMLHIYEQQTEYRDQLRSQGRDSVAEVVAQINSGIYRNTKVESSNSTPGVWHPVPPP